MLNHIAQNSSTISASTNSITSFLDLKPLDYNININDHDENVQFNNIYEQTISLASLATKLIHVSTPSPSYRSDYDFLSAFGILKSVPSPSSNNEFFSNKKRYILFNPPSPKTTNILDEQYYINKHKFGDKKTNKNDFIIMSTVFISDYDKNEDIEIHEYDG
ncbi:hypothetical protein RclHR1_00520024 [Rhizophagus clarus]|uniref:Uncharacterized protein n=1 Tax=Rhizophagus clarus TaxID=94130 RepID=A0A2Z6S4G3_9GLOM|nr:hypothetical protein RclHR1_00520024 [Rhizophagus clarus]GES77833.1 hypothetical protein GLOIN_2v1766389 [Rhizophagus clarus]